MLIIGGENIMKVIKTGEYYKIYSMDIDGFTDYYVSKINDDDSLIGIYETFAEALSMFKMVEEYAEKVT